MSEVPPPELIANMVELLKESIGVEQALVRLNAIEEALMAIDNEISGRDLLFGVLLPAEDVAREAIGSTLAMAGMLGYTPRAYLSRQRAIILGARERLTAEAS